MALSLPPLQDRTTGSLLVTQLTDARHVDRQRVLRQRMRTRQVPLYGDLRELGLNARAAPATVSGVPSSKTTGWKKPGKVMVGLQSREPGNLLIVVAHRPAGVC
jgi:hypothetical protein